MATDAIMSHTSFAHPRRWPRYKLDVPVRVIVSRADKTVVIAGRGTELNIGGMAIFAGVELSVGDDIGIEFTPPYSGTPLRVRCVVRNREGYRYGVEFLTLSAEERDRVEQMCEIFRATGSPIL
jgi:hypothetical protein